MTDDTIPLSQLPPGESAVVIRVLGRGALRRRYLEMGFVAGERVRAERVAPLGDPIEYLVKGYHLSLRRSDAAQILVRPNGAGRQPASRDEQTGDADHPADQTPASFWRRALPYGR